MLIPFTQCMQTVRQVRLDVALPWMKTRSWFLRTLICALVVLGNHSYRLVLLYLLTLLQLKMYMGYGIGTTKESAINVFYSILYPHGRQQSYLPSQRDSVVSSGEHLVRRLHVRRTQVSLKCFSIFIYLIHMTAYNCWEVHIKYRQY